MSYLYSFSVWPKETKAQVIFILFEYFKGRIELETTEKEFNQFRRDLAIEGFLLKEIERRKLTPLESII